MDRIKSKLHKLLALARQGVGGERDNAQSVLNKLLARHGLTVDDLDDESAKREIRWFTPKNDHERTLLAHCVAATLGKAWDGKAWFVKRSKARGCELTPLEHAQIELLFEVHKKLLAKQIRKQAEMGLTAYLSTNRLYAQDADRNDSEPCPLSAADIASIQAIMAGMRPTPVHKPLPAGQGKP